MSPLRGGATGGRPPSKLMCARPHRPRYREARQRQSCLAGVGRSSGRRASATQARSVGAEKATA